MLTTAQAAKILRVSPGTMANWRSWGAGPAYIRTGRRVGYTLGAVRTYLSRKKDAEK